ncbi:MAG: phosphotransferase [Alphaproteobacteria bacterium]|nr:phosphotransferase [Alphaproteobacteria bacterium]
MAADEPDFLLSMKAALARHWTAANGPLDLRRLSGGASQETWSFDLETASGRLPLIMRRAPGGAPRDGTVSNAPGLALEAEIIRAVKQAGVPVPDVPYVFAPEDGVGSAYLMTRIEGETIARKILRDPEFDAIRPHLARQCGEILARIHRCDLGPLRERLPVVTRGQLEHYEAVYRGYDYPHPVFDLAFTWLKPRIKDISDPVLVHGDFRNGNLMFGPDGVRAVLDWEIVHVGDPLEDLSWPCINSWRFGVSEKIVGGFGDLKDLLAGYRDAGGAAYTEEDVRPWIVLGSLKWGIMCMGMYQAFATGFDRSVERAAIGRRSSETEIDLLNLILGKE